MNMTIALNESYSKCVFHTFKSKLYYGNNNCLETVAKTTFTVETCPLELNVWNFSSVCDTSNVKCIQTYCISLHTLNLYRVSRIFKIIKYCTISFFYYLNC